MERFLEGFSDLAPVGVDVDKLRENHQDGQDDDGNGGGYQERSAHGRLTSGAGGGGGPASGHLRLTERYYGLGTVDPVELVNLVDPGRTGNVDLCD